MLVKWVVRLNKIEMIKLTLQLYSFNSLTLNQLIKLIFQFLKKLVYSIADQLNKIFLNTEWQILIARQNKSR